MSREKSAFDVAGFEPADITSLPALHEHLPEPGDLIFLTILVNRGNLHITHEMEIALRSGSAVIVTFFSVCDPVPYPEIDDSKGLAVSGRTRIGVCRAMNWPSRRLFNTFSAGLLRKMRLRQRSLPQPLPTPTSTSVRNAAVQRHDWTQIHLNQPSSSVPPWCLIDS